MSNTKPVGGRFPEHNSLIELQGGDVDEYYHLTNSEYNGTGTGVFVKSESPSINGNLILDKTQGNGIKVDVLDPTWGWRDIISNIYIRTSANDPDWATYRSTLSAYRFTNGAAVREAFVNFHIPHDYVPSTDMFIHVHWSQIVVDTGGTAGIPGSSEWHFDVSYANGHGIPGGISDPFITPKFIAVVQQGSTTKYGHMIAEAQFTNNGGDTTHIDRNLIQADGILLVRVWRDSGVIPDTLNQSPFVHFVDVHYQSTNLSTKNKAPNFYT